MPDWKTMWVKRGVLVLALAFVVQAAGVQQPPVPATNPHKPDSIQTRLVDINSASQEQLKTLPGIDDKLAQRIVNGRPYHSKRGLAIRGILPLTVYQKIENQIIALPSTASHGPGAPAR